MNKLDDAMEKLVQIDRLVMKSGTYRIQVWDITARTTSLGIDIFIFSGAANVGNG